MRIDIALLFATALSSASAGVIDPQHAVRDDFSRADLPDNLFRRKGGGAGGGRGGGSSSGGSSGGSSSGGSRGGGTSSGGSSGSGSGFRGNTGAGSNIGGTSKGGTGPPRSFGGGSVYGGGAAQPYRSGLATAAGVGALAFGAGALLFWPGLWLTGAYLYPHRNEYSFFNSTTQRQESLPVVCGCAQDAECGCDDNDTAMKDLVGNGSYSALNKSIINVGDYNGRKTFLVNGTLPNGTTADGPDQSAGTRLSAHSFAYAANLWPAVACVIAAVLMA